MPWRRGTARKSRGLPIQISRLIIITYSAIYWHLCFTSLLQKITVVDRQLTLYSNIGPNPRTNLNFSSLALTTKTPITWKRYPTPSYSKWRLNNIYPNTLKWVKNARNWIFSLLGTSKSIHLQYSQRLKKSESVQIIWVKSEKLPAHSTFEPGPSASKNLSLLRLSE